MTRSKRVWIVAGCLAAVPLLLVLGGILLTRPFAVRALVLPRVARSLGLPVQVGGMSIAPFSRVELRDIEVGDSPRPLLAGGLVRVRYGLWQSLRGDVRVDEVSINDLTLHLVRAADGRLNLPEGEAKTRGDGGTKSPETGAKSAPRLSIEQVNLQGIALIFEQEPGVEQTEIRAHFADLSLSVPRFGNGQTTEATLSGRIQRLQSGELNVQQGQIVGTILLETDEELLPRRFTADLALSGLTGSAGAIPLEGTVLRLNAEADGDGNAWQIQRSAMTLTRADGSELVVSLAGQGTREPAAFNGELAGHASGDLLSVLLAAFSDVSLGQPRVDFRSTVALAALSAAGGGSDLGAAAGWRFASGGNLTATDLVVSSPAADINGAGPFALSMAYDGAFDPVAKRLDVARFALEATESAGGVLGATLSAPVSLSLPVSPSADAPDADIVIRAERFPLALADLVLHDNEQGISLDGGVLDGSMTVRVRSAGERIEAAGELRAVDVRGRLGGDPIADLTLTHSARDTVLRGKVVELGTQTLDLVHRGERVVGLEATGSFTTDAGGTVTIQLQDLSEAALALAPLAPEMREKVAALRAGAELTATLKLPEKTLVAAGTINVDTLLLRPQGMATTDTVAVSGRTDVALAEQVLSWENLALQARSAEQTILDLVSSGSLPLALESGNVAVEIQAARVDGDALEALFASPGAAGTGGAGSRTDSPPAADPPAPLDLGPLTAAATLSVQHWTYGEMAGALQAHAALANNVLTVSEAKADVNGAPVTLSGAVDLSVPGYAYDLSAGLSRLSLAPLLGTFSPEFRGQVSGEITEFQARLSGQGTRAEDLRKTAAGSARVAFSSLVLDRLQSLQEAAAEWAIPVLGDMTFSALDAEAQLADGVVTIQSLTARGPSQAISAKGTVNLDGAARIDVDLGLAGELQKRLTEGSAFRYIGPTLQRRGEFLYIPVPVTLTGNLAAPRLDVTRLFENVKNVSAKDVIGGVLRQQLDRERQKEEERQERRRQKAEEATQTQTGDAAAAGTAAKTAGAEEETNQEPVPETGQKDVAPATPGAGEPTAATAEDEVQVDGDGKPLTEEERLARRKARRRAEKEKEDARREQLQKTGEALLKGLFGGGNE